MTNRSERGGCFILLKMFWSIVFFFALLFLIGVNLVFSNIFGETCGLIHPIIFEVEASIIEDTGETLIASKSHLPANQADRDNILAAVAAVAAVAENETGNDSNNDTSSELDTYLRIYDESGTTLLAFNDDFDNLGSSIRNFGLPETQEIIVEVGTFSDSSQGNFTLTVETSDDEIITSEYSDVTDLFGNIYFTDVQINNAGDSLSAVVLGAERVEYRMIAEANQAYNISVSGVQGAGLSEATALDTVLRIYDESATVLLAENDDTLVGVISSGLSNFGVTESQIIIIEVGTFLDSSVGEFTVSVSPVAEEINFADESNAASSVTIVDMGIQLDNSGDEATGFINVGERLRFTLFAEAGQAYSIQVAGINAFVSETSESTDTSNDIEIVDTSRRANYLFSAGNNAANRWSSCLQYFGFVSDSGYVINLNGFIWFVSGTEAGDKLLETCADSDALIREFLEQCVQATIRVSRNGRLIFFVLLAMLVVSLPIFIVDSLEGQREIVWYLFLMLVVVQATTTAMLFLHLGEVSGIEALSEFGYGIFGGITTGAALVFIGKVAERAKDHTSMMMPPDNERR